MLSLFSKILERQGIGSDANETMEKDNKEMLADMTGTAKQTGHQLLQVSYGEGHHRDCRERKLQEWGET